MKMNDFADNKITDDTKISKVYDEHKICSTVDPDSYSTNVPLYKRKDIIWKNVLSNFIFHAVALYGFLTFPYIKKFKTFLWCK